jgi:hypothetical protein
MADSTGEPGAGERALLAACAAGDVEPDHHSAPIGIGVVGDIYVDLLCKVTGEWLLPRPPPLPCRSPLTLL